MPSRRPLPYQPAAPLGFRIWKMSGGIAMPAAHSHADIEMNFILGGGLSYLHGGAVWPVEPLRLTVLWGGVPHCTLAPSFIKEGIWMTLPLGTFLRWQLPPRLVTRLFGGEIVAAPRQEIDRLLIERWLRDFESGHQGRRRALLLEIEARFHRLAWEAVRTRTATPRAARADASGGRGLRHVERITDYIARHYQEPLTVDAIAGALKLHGKYLMRLFKRHSRMSVWEYVTRTRLAHAQRLLLTSDMKIIDVALESGFESLGPFYRAFAAYSAGAKRPREYRRMVEIKF
jgi:AraC-like DNA-binding protein